MLFYITLLKLHVKSLNGYEVFEVCFFSSHEKVLVCWGACKEDVVKDQSNGKALTGVMS